MSGSVVSLGLNVWQTELVKAAKRLGHVVIGVDRDPAAPGVEHCDLFLPLSAHDAEGIEAELANRRVASTDIRAVMTIGSRGSITCASRLAKALNTRGAVIDEATAELLVDRGAFRSFLERAGLPFPRFAIVDDVAAEIPFAGPWIVKSVLDSSGSEGLTVVHDGTDMPKAIGHALAIGDKRGVETAAIVEQFIEGRDVGVFGLFQEGRRVFLSIVDRQVTPRPHCKPVRYAAPARLAPSQQAEVSRVYDALCAEMSVASGPIYAEMKLSDATGEAYVLEAEPTLPAYAARIVAEAHGVDLEDAFVRAVTGEPLDDIPPARAAACHFVYGAAGIFEKLVDQGGDDAATRLMPIRRPGDRLDDTDCSSISAVAFATAETLADAEARAADRARAVSVDVVSPTAPRTANGLGA